jgi:hypothetical protein
VSGWTSKDRQRAWQRLYAQAMREIKKRYPGEFDTLMQLQDFSLGHSVRRLRCLRALKDMHQQEFMKVLDNLIDTDPEMKAEKPMARGQAVEVGATRVAQNGYHYTKTEKAWRLTHHIVAEEKLGRPLRSDEMVKFGPGGKTDLSPSNIVVIRKGKASARRQLAAIEARIEDLQAQAVQLKQELSS